MLTFKEELLQCLRGPPPEGCITADTKILLRCFTCDWVVQVFRNIENKEKVAASVTLTIFLPTGCVPKSDAERIPTSFSICPKLELSKFHLKKRY